MKSGLVLAAIALSLCFTAGRAAATAQPKTIVGEWEEEKGDCGGTWAWHIGQKDLQQHAMLCDFETVVREGSKVTFTGSCIDGEHNERTKDVVTAYDGPNGLVLDFNNGNKTKPLRACKKR